MKSIKKYLWKLPITLMILGAWIGCGGRAEITTSASQSGGIMVGSDDLQRADKAATDKIGKNLVDVARRVSRESTKQMVDLVFIINAKLPRKDPERVERWIADMASVFDESMIDYRIAFIWFINDPENKGKPLVKTLTKIDEGTSRFSMKFMRFKGLIARYGLDAIMTGLREMKFYWDKERHFLNIEKHFVVITNEALNTDWIPERANEVVGRILEECRRDKIRIHVIGIGEERQMQLADLTGGKWYRIDENQLGRIRGPDVVRRRILTIDESFERIAQHIAETVKQPIDLVLVLDSSFSMKTKVKAICMGLDTLVQILEGEGLDYRLGIIRFWAAVGNGTSSIVTTKPPLNVEQVKGLIRTPKYGDEHLLDAIIEGLPKLQTPDNRKLVLVIVTDEHSSSGPEKRYTYKRAVRVCSEAGAQVNVIGAPSLPPGFGKFGNEFELRVTTVTNGRDYIMMGAGLSLADPHNR